MLEKKELNPLEKFMMERKIYFCHVPLLYHVGENEDGVQEIVEARITFAMEDPTKNTASFIPMGWSLCSPWDQFCRKTGRVSAARRLMARPLQVAPPRRKENESFSKYIHRIYLDSVRQFLETPHCPFWLREWVEDSKRIYGEGFMRMLKKLGETGERAN